MKGMTENAPRVVSAKRMEAIFRHEDVAYIAKCSVSMQTTNGANTIHKTYRGYLASMKRSLGKFLQGNHQIGVLNTPLS